MAMIQLSEPVERIAEDSERRPSRSRLDHDDRSVWCACCSAPRAMRLWGALFFVSLAACIDHPEAPVIPDGSMQLPPASSDDPSGGDPAQSGTPQTSKDPKAILTEVVYVLMDDYDGGHWMCTGSLVSAERVVTAAHCLDRSKFESFEIVAPLVTGKPRVSARNPSLIDDDYDDIRNPDIGFLRLDDPIKVPNYAKLTNVVERVEKGEKLTALTIVREKEDFEAPFKVVKDLAVTSTKKFGYDRGFATPMFSHGGDSGAGLFLVENGAVTHKLIAVARQPEPNRRLDHFTQIDDDFVDWYQANSGD